jgi:hypothetical protein
MSPLQAIRETRQYALEHRDSMTREEVDRLVELAERAYRLAVPVGLAPSFPQQAELERELRDWRQASPEGPAGPRSPPVQFVSRLNLPGDWDFPTCLDDDAPLIWPDYLGPEGLKELEQRPPSPPAIFRPQVTGRWLADMATLEALAEAQQQVAKPSGAHEQVDPVSRAIAIVAQAQHKGQKCRVKDLARIVGRAPSTLYRNPRFQAVWAAFKHGPPPPKGEREEDGNLEAWRNK